MAERQKKMKDICWSFHPLKEKPAKSALIMAVIIGCSIFSVSYIGSLPLSLPIVVFFLYSFHSFLLPSDYVLSSDYVSVVTPLGSTRRSWDKFHGYAVASGTVLLTRLVKPSFLDRLNGLELRVDKKEKLEKVVDFVKARLKA